VSRRVIAGLIMCGLLAVLAAALVVTGCSKDHRVVIESNTCWVAVFDRQSESASAGCGNVNYRISGTVHCVRVHNATDSGFVRVRFDFGPWSENSDSSGTAQVCQ